MKDPSLSFKNMWHILDPGSPCPPHHICTTWGLKDTIHPLIPPSVQPTDWVPGGAGWPGLEFQQLMEIKNQLWERLNEFMKLRS